MEFGDTLKKVRTQLMISQEDMAREMDISFPTYNKLENKKSKPSYDTQRAFIALCERKSIDIKAVK